jgi:hypothetical protein
LTCSTFAWETDAKLKFWGYNLFINGFSVFLAPPFAKSIFSLRKLRNVGWKEVYERLLARKCHTDERTHRLTGREKVIGRLAGQMTSVIFVLLKKDQELLARLAPGATPSLPDRKSVREKTGCQHKAMEKRKPSLVR